MATRSAAVTVDAKAVTPDGHPQVTKLGDVYKKVQLNLRVRRDLKERLEKHVLPLWKMVAEVKGQDADLIDLTYVCERILEGESLGELAHYGISEFPQTREGKDRLRADIAARVKTERETQ